MDPDIAYATMLDASASWEARAESAQALLRWLISGGFAPKQSPGPETAKDQCAAVTTLARANGWVPEPAIVKKPDGRLRQR